MGREAAQLTVKHCIAVFAFPHFAGDASSAFFWGIIYAESAL